MDKGNRIALLILRYNCKALTEPEARELMGWLQESEDNRLQFERLTDCEEMNYFLNFRAEMIVKLHEQTSPGKVIVMNRRRRRYAVAAVIFCMVVSGIFIYYSIATRNRTRNSGQSYIMIKKNYD